MKQNKEELYKELLLHLVSYDCIEYLGKKQEPVISHKNIPIYKKVFTELKIPDKMRLNDFFKEMGF